MTTPAPEHAPTPADLADRSRPQENTEDSTSFPADTPLAEMTDAQRAAYWRDKARKHESRVKAMADYADVKRKAEEYEKAQEAQASDLEKAIKAARDEGYQKAVTEANTKAAHAMLRASLSARGVKNDEIEDILAFTNASALVSDGDIDGEKILAFANRLAGKPGEPRPTENAYPDMGQGQRGNAPRQSAREAAKAVAVQRGLRQDTNA